MNKPAKTVQQQIAKLKDERGIIFQDETTAEQILLKYNYYRLSGYWRKYQTDPDKGDNNFVNNTTFEQVVEIYELDSKLRTLLLKGIEIFEVCFRTRFAYEIAHSDPDDKTKGPYLYLKKDSYNIRQHKKLKNLDEAVSDLLNNFLLNKIVTNPYESLVEKINSEISYSKEKFVTHYQYAKEDIPIWAVVEVLSIGTLSRMYENWKNKEVIKKVSSSFKMFQNYEDSKHIIHSLCDLRNLCAHQARIWNRTVKGTITKKIWDNPLMLPIAERFWNHSIMIPIIERKKFKSPKDLNERSQLAVIFTLMKLVDVINKNNDYSNAVIELCEKNEEFYKGLIDPTL